MYLATCLNIYYPQLSVVLALLYSTPYLTSIDPKYPKLELWDYMKRCIQLPIGIAITVANIILNWIPSQESWYEYTQIVHIKRQIVHAHKTALRIASEATPMRFDHHPTRTLYPTQIEANEVVAMSMTNSRGEPVHENVASFDTDSAKVGIDNRCSACISHDINDFEGPV